MTEKINLIYRTTDHKFGVHAKKRFFSDNRSEIAGACFSSLMSSINDFSNIEIIVIGDRLSDELKQFYKSFPQIVFIEEKFGDKSGLRDSIQKVLDVIQDIKTGWIWIQEDDYLFDKASYPIIEDTITNRNKYFDVNRDNLILFPCDYSDRYQKRELNKKFHIFKSKDLYWRQIPSTTFSWIFSAEHFQKTKNQFNQMIKEIRYKNFDRYVCDNIWSPNDLIVSPLPSLSFHLDENVSPPPFIDWKSIWDRNLERYKNGKI